ncbi:MAG: toprim domain-containing protein [Candidatus Bathyarchaeia archaeon]|jgi:5S rRNA maturation endonuclease (ribonuclease M5)
MRAPAAVRLERFQRLLDQISYESSNGSTIVVEGQKDQKSLRSIGITGPILCLQSSRSNFVGFVESLTETKRVIVLTDFDREGVSLAKKLSRMLTAQNLHVNMILWKSFRELTRSEVRSIEELPNYHERLQREALQKTKHSKFRKSSPIGALTSF